MAVQSKYASDSLDDLRTSPPHIESPYSAGRERRYILDDEDDSPRPTRSYQNSRRSVSASVYPHKSRSPASVAAIEVRYQNPATARVPANRVHQSHNPGPSRIGNRPRSVISISSDGPDLREQFQALDRENHCLQGQIDSLSCALSFYYIHVLLTIIQ